MSGGRAGVAAGHPLVAEAVAEVLQAGGNAFDGAIAGMAMACVAEPVLASLGGGGFLMAVPAGERPRLYDFFSNAPRGQPTPAMADDFRAVTIEFGNEEQVFNIGWGTTAVPGVVAGLFAVHRELARIPVRELLHPAARHAKDGVEVNAAQGHFMELIEAIFMDSAGSRAVFGSQRESGHIMRTGETMRQVELADALDSLAAEGPELFYRGEIAQAMFTAAGSQTPLTADDLAGYECIRREPLTADFEGARVHVNPPPAAGGVLVALGLQLLDGVGIGELAMGSSPRVRAMAAVLGAVTEARVQVQAEGGEAPSTASADAALQLSPELLRQWRDRVHHAAVVRAGTTQISIVDGDGNVAALTLSNGSGSGRMIPGTGIAMNNMLGELDLNPTGADGWPAGVRLSSMMAPSVVRWPDGRLAATGSGGSTRIRSAVLQVVVNLVASGLPAAEAVAAPRVHVDGARLSVECGFEPAELTATLADWPEHRVWERPSMFFGGAHTVMQTSHGAAAVADHRRGGGAATV